MSHQLVSPRPQPTDSTAAGVSLVDLLATRCADARDRRAIVDPLDGLRSWSWGEVTAAALRLAEALEAAGLRRGDRVAHVGGHGPDWIVVDLACLLAGIVHVALHGDASGREPDGWCGWLGVRGVVVSDAESRRRLPRHPPERIVVDAVGALTAGGAAPDHGLVQAEMRRRAAGCDADACAAILLSSGTTGRPHGVLHSQRALAANAVAAAQVFLDDPRDVRLSWLPLSHALARTGDLYTALVRGGCLAVVRDRTRLLDACRALPPTVILGVPAMFERLERGVASGRISDLAAALGGQVRVCVSGGAPLRRRTADFFAARGVPLVEGYGLAEAGPVVTLSNPRIMRPGTVGPPVPGVEVRIDDRPATRGQLLVRTPSRALGVMHPDDPRPAPAAGSGADATWLETGDLAELDAAGHVRITGRLRDVLVLASGVKAAPAMIEAALAEDDAVAQVCVVAAAGRPAAVVVPEPTVLRAAIRRLGLVVVSRRHAVAHPRVRAWLARRLARRQRSLPKAWRVSAFVVAGRPFDTARGETTESLKLRRDAIARGFATEIEACVAARRPPHAAVETFEERGKDGAGMRGSWLCGAVWRRATGGFAEAAARAAEPLPSSVEAVLDRAAAEIGRLRAEGMLYDPLPTAAAPSPPLDDPPPPPFGRLSARAEEALGETGLWGLAVPAEFGGAGCGMLDLARGITQLATGVPTVAGMLAVHSSIGAVSAVTAFGTPAQRRRHLPGLAAGRPLSIFGATEPDAGCDLGRVRSLIDRRADRLLLTGTKMFITGATYGRMVKVLAMLDGRPAVALVRLPDGDTPAFRLRRYALHPLKHAHNAALEFTRFELDPDDVLDPGAVPAGGDTDAMRIVWHGLNRGRVTLAAQAAGTLRLLLAQARDHATRRLTWSAPIGTRQLVQGRLGRIAASIVACDAVTAWAASAIDAGQSGEWEAIVAKVVASTCVRDAAIDALGVHGGRAFLVGHPLGDSLHDHFAVTVYEGESDLLGLAAFKGIAKSHPAAAGGKHASAFARAAAWVAWRAGGIAASSSRDRSLLDARLRGHARLARRLLDATAVRIDRAIRRHGRGLAARQLEVGQLAADVRELASILAVAHHADASGDDGILPAADCWCRLGLARVRGGRLTPADHAALAAVGGETLPAR